MNANQSGRMRLPIAVVAIFLSLSPAEAQKAPAADIALLVPDTLSCYQNLTKLQVPSSIGDIDNVFNGVTRAASGDLSLLRSLPAPNNSNPVDYIKSRAIRHSDYSSAVRYAADSHDIHALKLLYALCHARNPQSMQKLYGARDEQIMSAAHHVVECYYPKPHSRSDSDQCISAPAE